MTSQKGVAYSKIMQGDQIAPALLTRQELAFLSNQLLSPTNRQKADLNYKIREKLKVFENVELPPLQANGFVNPRQEVQISLGFSIHTLQHYSFKAATLSVLCQLLLN